MITYETWDDVQKPTFPIDNKEKGAVHVLTWAYDHYGDDLLYACSFGIEGIVLIDLISQVRNDAEIVFLDTHVHFAETYETIERVKQAYPRLRIHLQSPSLSLAEQEQQFGAELWKKDPNKCCELRKIIPLRQAIAGKKAWISGLRREQSPTRQHVQFINLDKKFKSIKVCPLIHWTWKDVWRYVHRHNLAYNPLHDRGYPSIGCAPCTAPAYTEEDLRSGRWAGLGKTECGLHES
ncbi:phosphoadenylyl-sulfate reductase [Anoxybacillus flavithermus]|uniref:Adenosine 5'-phosphosulfate reductase n=1 Tax=Anoxybacillus flavithermus AK1 TaxID=1297581 RepID=M8DWK0_9BACL|nr:phosphoadenylyl-sulfate reductase [Anoxybacillus flavithermus]EMT45114.1 phosphoadenosine phosphosulfate reductase [Anoxybacillus flavithermus AK1]